MKEDVLQYIWKSQSFDSANLQSTHGEPLSIITQGMHNQDAGPDFTGGRVIIQGIEWAGDIEIHTNSSLWESHKHHLDPAYNKVILHVVWEHDKEITRADGSIIPTLELKSKVADIWLQKYRMLASSLQTIPCQSFIKEVEPVYFSHAFSRALMERLKRKSKAVTQRVAVFNGDWNRASYQLLIANFGFKKNKEAFERLGSLVDYAVCRKLSTLQQMEAYLFGMAGLIPEKSGDAYVKNLKHEFDYITKKFTIAQEPMMSQEWLFMRMRPANFPTLRIAQLAGFLFIYKDFFRVLIELPLAKAPDFFRVSPSEYWRSHYHFNKAATRTLTGLGQESSIVLSANVAAVLLMAYGEELNNENLMNKAMAFLEKLPAEDNMITRTWRSHGISIANTAESQAGIELFNNYCKKAGCLSCSVGNKILKPI